MKKQKYGRLTPVRRIDEILWEFECDCGKTIQRTMSQVKGDKIGSCGCLRSEKNRDLRIRQFLDNPRNEEVVKKRKAGMTLAAIGKEFGISRQRVHQILLQAEAHGAFGMTG